MTYVTKINTVKTKVIIFNTRGPKWPFIAHLNHVIHNIANRDAGLKVMVTLTMTFALWVIFWSEETFLLEGPSPKHCRDIGLLSTRGHLCHKGHPLVKTNIRSKFKCSSRKHCQIIRFLVLKVMMTSTMTFTRSVINWLLSPSIAKLSSFLVLKVLVTLTFALRIIYC